MNFDDIELEDLLEFLEAGNAANVPPKLLSYMQMLEKIWGMYRRMLDFPNKEAIITHLVAVDNLQRYQAVKLVNDALNYFAAESSLPKRTWLNLLVEKMMLAFTASIRLAKTSKDIVDSVKVLVAIRETIPEDAMSMDEDLMKQIQVLSTDISMFGEEPEDRRAIAQFIDSLPDVPEKVKEAAKAEVDGIPFRFLKYEENPRNTD